MNNKLDKEIKNALLKETEDITSLQESIWNNIEASLSSMEQVKPNKVKDNRFKVIIPGRFAKTAATLVLIFLLASSKPGMAAIGKVKSMFVPEKKITQEIEGIKEEENITLKENNAGYILYLDESYFMQEHFDGKDKITPKNKPADKSLPEIYMEISQVRDKIPSDIYKSLETELKATYKAVTPIGQVNSPMKALRISAATGTKWNDKKVVYYIVDNKKGGSFVIKQQIFIEAEEGMGARFANILKEFKIVD